MTRIRQIRRGVLPAAVVVALLAVPSTAAAANLTLTAPGSINHNTSYRLMASGQVGKRAYVIVVYQHRSCSTNYAANQAANAKNASGGAIIYKKVGPGTYDAESVKLKGGVKGSVQYCGYLYGARQDLGSKPLARASHKVNFT